MGYSVEALEGIELPTHRGGRILVGGRPQRPQLVCFVPYAYTPVCGVEIDGLVDLAPDAEQEGIDLVVVSCDSDAVLAAWLGEHIEIDSSAIHGASDFWPHGHAARAFGVFDEERGVPDRVSVAINRDGAVRLVAEALPGEARPHRAHVRALDWLAGGR